MAAPELHRTPVVLAALLAGLLALAPARAGEAEGAPEPAPEPSEAPAAKTLGEMLGTQLPEAETGIFKYIENALGGQTRKYLSGRVGVPLHVRQAVGTGIEKNLDIQLAGHDDEIRKSALEEAKAAFLPVFNVSVQRQYVASYNRKRIALISKPFVPFIPPVQIPAPSPIVQINFVPFKPPRTEPDFQFASKRDSLGQKRPINIVASVSQVLPWGASYTLTSTSVFQKTYSRRRKSYDAPWITSLDATLSFPLPFTKDFGPHSPVDVGIKLAKLDEQRAYWDLRAVINSTLAVIDIAYWDLVAAMLVLDNTIKNRETLELLQKNTKELLDAGRVTQYSMDQVDSEVLRIQELEEQVWNNYIATSDRLVTLLNLDAASVLIPYGYSKMRGEQVIFDPATALQTAMANRPELTAERLGFESAKVEVEFQHHRLRPDLSTSSSINMAQLNNEIGFYSWGKAFANVMTPDARTMRFSLTYTYPFFNRALRSQYRQSVVRKDDQKLVFRITENTVTQEVHDALAAIDTSRRRVQHAQEGAEAAKKSVELARQRADRLTEFEMVSRIQQWLIAENTLVAARVDLKRAETQLLFAQGLLPDLYPSMTAQNEFEAYRLGLLQETGALHFFNKGEGAKP